MATPFVSRRYISAVYEDKYFPEKNATIPFKWETSPGTPKFDDDDHNEAKEEIATHDSKQGSCMHNMGNESYTSIKKDNYPCMRELHSQSVTDVHAMSGVYPLRPPPAKADPASTLRVKDLLLHHSVRDHDLSDDDESCPLHAYHHGFSRLSIRFRSRKASTVVPIHKNHCVIKQPEAGTVDKSQPSSLVLHARLQGRSQSFNYAAMHGAAGAAATCAAANGNEVLGDASMQVPGRRCNSFSSHSAHHSIIDHIQEAQDGDGADDDDVNDDPSSMAASAVWAGACILAAAAAHDVASANHHQHGPCRVAMKLRDLLQQSTNFSELELPNMRKLKKGGGSIIDENLAQLALCHASSMAMAAKRKTTSLEEEAMEAFLSEGIRKSCAQDEDDDFIVEDVCVPTKEKAMDGDDDQPGKLVKRRRFFKVLKNGCIACWCPASTL